MSKHNKHRKRRKHRKRNLNSFINPKFSWHDLDGQTKKALILGIALLFSLTAMVAGTQFMIMLFMATGIVSYTIFGEEFINWFNQHEYLLLGATFGLIASNFNPMGLFLGLWFGYFINQKLNQIFDFGGALVEKVNPIVQPIGFTATKFNQFYQYCIRTVGWKKENPTIKSKKTKKRRRTQKKSIEPMNMPTEIVIVDRAKELREQLNSQTEFEDHMIPMETFSHKTELLTPQFTQQQDESNSPIESSHTTWGDWCYNALECLCLSGG